MIFYRWPCGMFESLGGPWSIYSQRPTPTTPQGDLVASFSTKEEADAAVQRANAEGLTLEQAREVFK